MSEIKGIETPKQRWTRETVQPSLRKAAERRDAFTTLSGHPVERLYAPEDVSSIDYARDRQDPATFPYVRGVDRTSLPGAGWIMRASGVPGTAEEGNRHYRQLIAAGATGLSLALDRAGQQGHDPGDARDRGTAGQDGLSIASLADMEQLFAGIALDQVTPAVAVDGPAAMMLAMYLVVAEQHGTAWTRLAGSIQHDILGHRITNRRGLFPVPAAMRLVRDVVAFCDTELPHWDPMVVSGYQMREAGASAGQELAFALGCGLAYLRALVDAGLEVDRVAPRLSFVFDARSDFFEELAKLRAARKLWAEAIRDRFGATDPRSWQLRCLTRTSVAALTAQQPYNNVVRTATQAMSAVLGGTRALQVAAFDEPLAHPTDAAATLALRTQQIIAYESGVARSDDPLGGSYFVEALTREIEQTVRACWTTIDGRGGMVPAIEQGHPQREIADAARQLAQAVERRERVIVGVTDFLQHEEPSSPGAGAAVLDAARIQAVAALKVSRNDAALRRALAALGQTATGTGNLMPALLDCARAYATLGEMCDVLRGVWGEEETGL